MRHRRRSGHLAGRRGGERHRGGRDRHHRLHPDHDRGVPPHPVRGRGGAADLQGPGADRDLLAHGEPGRGPHADTDAGRAGLAAKRSGANRRRRASHSASRRGRGARAGRGAPELRAASDRRSRPPRVGDGRVRRALRGVTRRCAPCGHRSHSVLRPGGVAFRSRASPGNADRAHRSRRARSRNRDPRSAGCDRGVQQRRGGRRRGRLCAHQEGEPRRAERAALAGFGPRGGGEGAGGPSPPLRRGVRD